MDRLLVEARSPIRTTLRNEYPFGNVALLLRKNPRLAALAVFLGGVMTASNPCAAPILLAVLLAFVAEKGNAPYGGLLLIIYALDHSFLILVAGTSMGAAKKLIESKGLKKTSVTLQKAAGVVIILVGVYLLVR